MKPEQNKGDFDIVQIAIADVHGVLRGEMEPWNIFQKSMKKGTQVVECLNIFGLNTEIPWKDDQLVASKFGNFSMLPDPDTLVELPWSSKPGRKVGQVLCTAIKENGMADETCSRSQTIRQLTKLKSYGITLLGSFTFQFKVFKTGSNLTEVYGATRSNNTSAYGFLGVETELLDLVRDLKTFGVAVESLSHADGPGCFEVTTSVAEDIKIADMAIRLKFAIKSVLAKKGYTATFMSQPHAPNDKNSSVLKLRYSLRCPDGQNPFSDSTENGLSDFCRTWIAGFLSHGPALTALFCQTVNCYRKFTEEDASPKRFDWAINNPLAALSTKVSPNGDVWLETSLPSPACNPYFPIIGILATGLDAMEKTLSCPDPSSPDAVDIPVSLTAAMDALKNDDVLRNALTEAITKTFLITKRDFEVNRIQELKDKENDEEKLRALERELYFQIV